MPHHSAKRVWLVLILIFFRYTLAAPRVAFPINSQLPPVAYALQPFNFTFSPSTFTSDTPDISYSLTNQPAWLSLDSSARTLSGTPTSQDVGASNFEIVASDASGTTPLNVTLIVLQQTALSVNGGNILSQLARFGPVSEPTTLLLYPQQTFTLSFTSDLFEGVSDQTTYYATSSDGSPLPSWIQFDAASIQFSGTTPPLLAPQPSQQTFSFDLAATNTAGFSEARARFEVLVSNHILTFVQTSFNFTIPSASVLEIPSLLDELQIDGTSVRRDQIASATANTPSWLLFNDTDFSFTGNVPSDAESTSFALVVNGIQSNSANSTITVTIEGPLNSSRDSLGNVTVLSGSYFSYAINKPDIFANNTDVTVDSESLPMWLSFNPTNLTLQGLVPDFTSSEVEIVSFVFTSDFLVRTAHLILNIDQANPSSSNNASTSTTAGTTKTSQTSGPSGLDDQTSLTGKRLAILILAIVVPVIVVALLVSVIIMTMRKRRRQQQSESAAHDNEKSFSHPPTNRPESKSNNKLDMSGALTSHENAAPSNSSVPQVELSWAPDSLKNAKKRMSKKMGKSRSSILGLGWDDPADASDQVKDNTSSRRFSIRRGQRGSIAAQSSTPQSSPQRPVRPVRPTSLYVQRPSEMFRSSVQSNGDTKPAVGEPSRLSGAGHGAGGDPTSGRVESRISWQVASSAMPRHDSKSSAAVMNSFPAPPDRSSMAGLEGKTYQPEKESQRTVRIVENEKHEAESREEIEQGSSAQRAPVTGTIRLSQPMSRRSAPSRRSSDGRIARFPSLHKLDEANNRDMKGKGVVRTPPIPQKSQARQRSSHISTTENKPQEASGPSRISRVVSTASSHQFDSAVSSDSHWEDQDVVPEEATVGNTYGPGRTHPPRVADLRQHVSIENPKLGRSEQSQRGSFRFV